MCLIDAVDCFRETFTDVGSPFLSLGAWVLWMGTSLHMVLTGYCSYGICMDDIIDFCLTDR